MTTLQDVLELVGTLDDTLGENTARERFRNYLERTVRTAGLVRDYIETCLRTPGPQFDKALQDLVNHTGRLIGFEVEFGRYRGAQGAIGFGGIWRHGDFSIIFEVKTTDAYAIKTTTLVGYVDRLISERRLQDWDHSLGLYVIGRTDPDLRQLEHSIVAERRTYQLRIATVDSLLSIAELVEDGHISKQEAVALLRPGGVTVDAFVKLLVRVAAETDDGESASDHPKRRSDDGAAAHPVELDVSSRGEGAGARLYLLTPMADDDRRSVSDTINELVRKGLYVFGDRTPHRKRLKAGDKLCFYHTGVGVVAEATVASAPIRKPAPGVLDTELYPWSFMLKDQRYFLDAPVVIDQELRSRLEAFNGRSPELPWSWFVQGTHKVSAHDFQILVGKEG